MDWTKLPQPEPKDKCNPIIGHCPKCGLDLRKMMWYSCNRESCPSGLGSKVEM